jgi:hypothetical protein
VQNYMEDHELDFNTDLQRLLDGEIKGHQRPWRKIGSSESVADAICDPRSLFLINLFV